jgi:hypothetical protein
VNKVIIMAMALTVVAVIGCGKPAPPPAVEPAPVPQAVEPAPVVAPDAVAPAVDTATAPAAPTAPAPAAAK